MEHQLDRIESKIDSLSNKLDNHIVISSERITKTETNVEWLQGHVKIVISLAITAFGGMAAVIYQYLAN